MQDFGSNWDWFIKNVLPVLQLVMTLVGSALGAGIGGWVAIRTTTRALEGAAERERIAREASLSRELAARDHARKAERVNALRAHAERYVELLMQLFAFEAELETTVTTWCADLAGPNATPPVHYRPPNALFSELHMLELLHLKFMRGTAPDLADHADRYLPLHSKAVAAKMDGKTFEDAWSPEQRAAIAALTHELAQLIQAAAATLSDRIEAAERELD